MESKVICSYEDCLYIKHNGKTYFVCLCDMVVKEIEEVARITLNGKETEEELLHGLLIDKEISYNYTGELDTRGIYCYWRDIDG